MEDFTCYCVVATILLIYFTTTTSLYHRIYRQCKNAIVVTTKDKDDDSSKDVARVLDPGNLKQTIPTTLRMKDQEISQFSAANRRKDKKSEKETNGKNGDNWRCVCETGFLPPGLLKSFGGMESVLRMSTGQCYHKAP
jgi:hypothetical protein